MRFMLTLLLLVGVSSIANALEIVVGVETIGDRDESGLTPVGPRTDIDPLPDAIAFDSSLPVPRGFALPPGSSVSKVKGVVSIGPPAGGGAIAGLGDAVAVVLGSLEAETQLGAGTDELVISFQHTFTTRPPARGARVVSSITGNFRNVNNVPMDKDKVSWQAFIGTAPISRPDVIETALGVGNPFAIDRNSGPLPLPVGVAGPPWTLKGELKITIAGVGTILSLPTSAVVGIGSEPSDLPIISSKWVIVIIVILLLIIGTGLIIRRSKRAQGV